MLQFVTLLTETETEVWRESVKCFIVLLLFRFDFAKLTYIELSNSVIESMLDFVIESMLDFAVTGLFEDHWVLFATYSTENKLEEFCCCIVIDTWKVFLLLIK